MKKAQADAGGAGAYEDTDKLSLCTNKENFDFSSVSWVRCQ